MSREKELAFRYDLFITPEWRDRFDVLVNEKARPKIEGRILDVNTGTGSHAIELAEHAKGKGEVIAVDPNPERLEIARAKALVKKVERLSFERAEATALPFGGEEFDLVIGDASLVPSGQVGEMLSEMLRVAKPKAQVILKLATWGSFDEFFSIYWEALLGLGIVEEVWTALEAFIKERPTVSDAVEMAKEIGLRKVETVSSREEFSFETGGAFMESPLIRDTFLTTWLSIIPEGQRAEVSDRIASLIEAERNGLPFEVSMKATLIYGIK